MWLERGGILAVANLRGGGEYGEGWHQAGMLERKQNVFDDFIAAAEWLIASGYTRREKLAIQGGSNGGLLVGAAMTQRPDLSAAVVCQVPVADMLRYHLFTVGRFWIPEYGSADDPQHFPVLYALLAAHNVKDGVGLPGDPLTTADTDDRVAPGMAKKFAARLQAAQAGERAHPHPRRDQSRPWRRQARSRSRSTSRPTSTRSCSRRCESSSRGRPTSRPQSTRRRPRSGRRRARGVSGGVREPPIANRRESAPPYLILQPASVRQTATSQPTNRRP